ncbi:MAG: cation diffusion facilitator family transporter [Lentisphaeria bacterium]
MSHSEWKINANSGKVIKVTAIGLVYNVGLCIIKVFAGVVGNSQAVLADGVHSLSDIASDLVVITGAKFWSEPADSEHPYGHGRVESVVSLGIAALLAAAGAGIVFSALSTLQSGQKEAPGWIAAAAAALSLLIKEGLYRWTIRRGRETGSSALEANAWHHRSDALSSIPALLAVIGAKLFPEWWLLDPIGGIVVSVLILHAAWAISRQSLQALIDRGASEDEVKRIRQLASQVEGVIRVHAIRTRSLGQGWNADLHVLVDPALTVREGHDIAERVHELLLTQGPRVADTLVHIEPFDQENSKEGGI